MVAWVERATSMTTPRTGREAAGATVARTHGHVPFRGRCNGRDGGGGGRDHVDLPSGERFPSADQLMASAYASRSGDSSRQSEKNFALWIDFARRVFRATSTVWCKHRIDDY